MSAAPIKSLNELIESGIIQLTRGKIISKKDIAACPGTYPIYSSAKDNEGKFGEYGKYLFDEELITWSVDGGGRLFHRPKHKFSVTNVGGVLRILDKSVIGYRYLYYALTLRHSEIVFDWVKKAHPSVIRKLYAGIPIPPLPEQQRIVALLDEAFAGLATAKANAEKNLQNARDICQSHLDSFLLQCGEQWEQKELGEVCEFENGDRGENYPNKSARTATGVPFINAGHLTGQGLDMESMDFISRERFNLLGAGKVKPRDVLFCLRGSLGKHASVGDLVEGAIASSLVIIRPGPCLIDAFLLAYLGCSICSDMIDRYKNGAAQPNLSAQSLRRFVIPVPPLEEQQRICTEFEALSTQIQRLTRIYARKIAALEELKKSLLQQAFNGVL